VGEKGRKFRQLMVLALVLTATISCDRVTKRLAVTSLAGRPAQSFVMDTVRVGYAENTGGFLSAGAAWPAVARVAVFNVADVAILAGALLVVCGDRIRRL
jgi:signal peptidase II